MGATSAGLRYPELGDSPNAQTAVKNLADDLNGKHIPVFATTGARDTAFPSPTDGQACYVTALNQLLVRSSGAWVAVAPQAATNFTPNVYTNMGTTPSTISRTVNLARYWRMGSLVIAQADCTINATTTNGIGIDLPFAGSVRILNLGTCALFGTSTPADQSGIAYMAASLTQLVVVAYSQGFRDGTSGQTLRYSVQYAA